MPPLGQPRGSTASTLCSGLQGPCLFLGQFQHQVEQHLRARAEIGRFGMLLHIVTEPSTEGTKIIAVGQSRCIICASWPAPDGMRRVLSDRALA